ncbi:MAG: hypothetical protein Q7T96_13950 [Methylobacter sp.]|uniref:hypothetical protein n=1 Tax=Methylobacter sp. TaxID=2051955 RepID=UPI0027287B41|nr:hypothetical protein [Methylobacter sp.]MDO9270205.1 hypothetical protein [Methylobacter sp.]MDP1666300.1 hypothetical protein [Methylobacter sp.]
MTSTSRLDELFAPERLRQNWQINTTAVLEPPQVASNLDIHAKYDELQRLIGEKFPDVSRLSGRFEALTETINHTFPLEAVTPPVDAKSKETLVGMLEQLEALLWAMDMARKEVR